MTEEEKGMTEEETVRWHHLTRREFEQAPGDEGQGDLVCCSPRGCREWDTTEQLNNNNTVIFYQDNTQNKKKA